MKLFYAILCAAPLWAAGQATNFPLTSVRQMDGSDGNVGAKTGTKLLRVSGFDYPGDGSGSRVRNFPNPRIVSTRCLRQPKKQMPSKRNLTDFAWQWGQFIDHDLDLTPADTGGGTANIPIRFQNDPMGKGTMEFKRALFNPNSGIPGRPREHINIITSVIDAGHVYGNDDSRADFLRAFEGGLLKTHNNETRRSRMLPPLNTGGFENEGNDKFDPQTMFLCGDLRANEQFGLLATHTLFVREHNRLSKLIARKHRGASDEQIYQFARKIVNMEIAKVTYDEWLPALLGPMAPRLENYRGYDPNVDVSIAAEFSGGAFRFGHSMISGKLEFMKKDGGVIKRLMRDAFFAHNVAKNKPFRVDQVLQGLTQHVSQEVDVFVVEDVRNFLFGEPGDGGMDLASANIQRGRDYGLPKYNEIRAAYNLTRHTTFAEISSDRKVQEQLEREYLTPDRLDLWVGCLAEDHVEGASVGELLGTIVADQFDRLMHGDKFFFLNDPDLKRRNLQGIMAYNRINLANLIRLNTFFKPPADSNVFFMPADGTLAS